MNKYQITFQTWNKIADLYEEKFMDLNLYNDSYDLFCEQIKVDKAHILEIGCGPGNITQYLLEKRPDFQLLGTDIAPNMIALAKKNNPTAQFQVMDAREIYQLGDRYDGIICGFCMPYLSKSDCEQLIDDSYHLLQEGGVLYFSTIEGEEQQSGFEVGSTGDRAYVYYHAVDFLKTALQSHQFKLIDLIKIKYPKSNHQVQTHLIFIAQK